MGKFEDVKITFTTDRRLKALIEWILNDLPFLNQDIKQKLEDKLITDLLYYKDGYGNTIRIEVI